MPYKILIVDDERIVCEDLVQILSSKGYGIAGCAGSGRIAIELAKQNPPDLIIMDIKLDGDLNGIETAIVIQTDLDRSIPVVFLTAFNPREFPILHVVDHYTYLNKPYTEGELINCVESAFKQAKSSLL